MIIILALVGFVLLMIGLFFLLKDFCLFIIKKTIAFKSPREFVDFGEHTVTFFVVFCVSLLGILFYKFATAFIAYLFSKDLISFFITVRGVFTIKNVPQNPFAISHLIPGLFIAPALQFITFYFIFRGIRAFMFSINRHYKNSTYSEGDVLYFGFWSAIIFIFFEIVFYSQNIPRLSGIAHLTYLSVSKLASICYYLAVAHVHFLKQEQYRAELPTYINLSKRTRKIVFSPWKVILLTYIIGVVLYIPFVTGTQFLESNSLIIIIYLCSCSIFYITIKLFLSKGFNYLGVVMLAESPEHLSQSPNFFKQKTERKIFWALGSITLIFSVVKLKLLFLVLFCFAAATFLFLFLFLFAYLIGFTHSFLMAKVNKIEIPKIQSKAIANYLMTTMSAFLQAVAPMLTLIFLILFVLTISPKKYKNNNENYVNSVFDEKQNPLLLEHSENNSCFPIPYNEIPDFLLKCLYIQEDRSFIYQENWLPNLSNWHGISIASMYRIFFGGGGSNLNMQLIKNVAFPGTFPQDIQRKFSESLASYQLSLQCSKEEIVTQYLNEVSMNGGQGQSGIMAASLYTFGLPLNKLYPIEMMYLIATLKRGSQFKTVDGYVKYEDASQQAIEIKTTLLQQAELWHKQNLITKKEFAMLKNQNLRFVNKPNRGFCATTTREFLKKQMNNDALLGKTYRSTLSFLRQQQLSKAVDEYELRLHGYKKKGSYNLYSAALVVNVKTGEILAHHGGDGLTDLAQFSDGNQIGSLIKPFILLEFLEAGHTPDEIKFFDGQIKGKQTPNNYSRKYSNKNVGINEILGKSLNAPMVNIREVTEPIQLFRKVEERFYNMGISRDRFLQIIDVKKRNENEINYPLGSRNMTLYDVTQAYQTLFNDGVCRKLTAFGSVFNPYENIVKKFTNPKQKIYSEENVQIIKSALKHTMQPDGTGMYIKNILPNNRTFFAKTGTSDKAKHGYTVLCDGEILIVAFTTYGRIENGRLELNNTPPIPFESGVRSAGVLAANIYTELFSTH